MAIRASFQEEAIHAKKKSARPSHKTKHAETANAARSVMVAKEHTLVCPAAIRARARPATQPANVNLQHAPMTATLANENVLLLLSKMIHLIIIASVVIMIRISAWIGVLQLRAKKTKSATVDSVCQQAAQIMLCLMIMSQ
jgi:hypothetical protein